jgi:hypothetical protein
MDHTEFMEDSQLSELLGELLKDGHITHEVEIGIARKIIAGGFRGLSASQRDIYTKYIEPLLNNETVNCKLCQTTLSDLPTNEKYTLITTGYCPRCNYNLSKED